MMWVPVRSSNLRAVGYDSDNATLYIAFHGGRVYGYANVPWYVYVALLAAESHGTYFHARIYNKYAYWRIA